MFPVKAPKTEKRIADAWRVIIIKNPYPDEGIPVRIKDRIDVITVLVAPLEIPQIKGDALTALEHIYPPINIEIIRDISPKTGIIDNGSGLFSARMLKIDKINSDDRIVAIDDIKADEITFLKKGVSALRI